MSTGLAGVQHMLLVFNREASELWSSISPYRPQQGQQQCGQSGCKIEEMSWEHKVLATVVWEPDWSERSKVTSLLICVNKHHCKSICDIKELSPFIPFLSMEKVGGVQSEGAGNVIITIMSLQRAKDLCADI